MKHFAAFSASTLLIVAIALAQERPPEISSPPDSTEQGSTMVAQSPNASQPAKPKESLTSKKDPEAADKGGDSITTKDWITWGIMLLIATSGVILVRKKKEAELRAEHEHNKRVELEERQRKVEDHRALLSKSEEFKREQAEKEQTQKTKTSAERYRYALETEVCQIHLAAPGIEEAPVSLDRAFVHLNISEDYRSEDFAKLGESGRTSGEHDDLKPEEVMRRAFKEFNRRLLLIIGDPGSGKTTLLKYYTMCCLKRDGYRSLGFERPIFPFYLPLRDLDTSKSLAENLADWAEQRELTIDSHEFHTWLHEQDTLVLFDGLDEVSELADRKEVCRWIDNKASGLKQGHFILTSRSTGIRGKNLVLKTPHLRAEVRDFSPQQKQEFLSKWFTAAHLEGSRPLEHESESEWRRRQLNEAKKNTTAVLNYLEQKENQSLRELAGIPMLLQLIALIWKKHKSKPESRTELYDIALNYLLEYRDDQRNMRPLLRAEKARRILKPISLWMQEDLNADEVGKGKMHEAMLPLLGPIDHTVKPAELCTNLRDRAGIIADHGKNEYIFRHKSFREYFAGLQLLSNYGENDRLSLMAENFGETWWSETTRYFISKADGKAFTAFMNTLFNSEKSRDLSQEQQDLLLGLVAEAPEKPVDAFMTCLEDGSKNEYQKRYALDCLKTVGGEPVRKLLENYTKEKSSEEGTVAYAQEIVVSLVTSPASKIREGRGILHLRGELTGKAEVSVKLQKSFRNPLEFNAEYIRIPGGSFCYSVTGKPETVPDIYFARYPVTNRRYRYFIRYLSGDEPELIEQVPLSTFGEKLLEFARDVPGYEAYLGGDPRSWPVTLKSGKDDDRKFNHDDQPVVSVSWFAAQAYCFWLSLCEISQRGDGLQQSAKSIAGIYGLPHEMEWERAAAGLAEEKNTPRKYPWGNGEPNDKKANYGGNTGATTQVGRYPDGATPEGLLDMAGNVWEWQENWSDENEKRRRSLRGGSWNDRPEYLECSIRSRDVPDVTDFNVGFRVVRPQSSVGSL